MLVCEFSGTVLAGETRCVVIRNASTQRTSSTLTKGLAVSSPSSKLILYLFNFFYRTANCLPNCRPIWQRTKTHPLKHNSTVSDSQGTHHAETSKNLSLSLSPGHQNIEGETGEDRSLAIQMQLLGTFGCLQLIFPTKGCVRLAYLGRTRLCSLR